MALGTVKIIDTSASSLQTGAEIYHTPGGKDYIKTLPFNTDWEYFSTQEVNVYDDTLHRQILRRFYDLGGSQWISDEFAGNEIKSVRSKNGTCKVGQYGAAIVRNVPNGIPKGTPNYQSLPEGTLWKYNEEAVDTWGTTWFNVGHSQWVSTQQVIDQSGGGTQGGWGWPFAAPLDNGDYVLGGQAFGYTRPGWKIAFHDGADFDSVHYGTGDRKIRAIHSGTVVFEGNPGSQAQYIGNEIIVIRTDSNLDIIYQEFGVNSNDASVHLGDHVNVGDVIGYFDVGGYNGVKDNSTISHVHIGISNRDWSSALSSYAVDDGTYYDPIKVIRNQGI